MLKRVLVFLVIVGCVSQFCAGINSYAREVNDSNAVVEQVYEDGSYIESTVVLDRLEVQQYLAKRNILIKVLREKLSGLRFYMGISLTMEHLQNAQQRL